MTYTADLDGLPGLTYRKIDYWLRRGYVPGCQPFDAATGSGNPRNLNDAAVRNIRLMGILTAAGVSLSLARLAVESWPDHTKPCRFHIGGGVFLEVPPMPPLDATDGAA